MTKCADAERTAAALRGLDPAATTTLSEDERRRADAALARIVATPDHEAGSTPGDRPRRRIRGLGPAALLAAGVVALSMVLTGGPAFADWTATPTPLTLRAAATAAETCRSGLAVPLEDPHVVLAERRGGWTSVLLDAPTGEAACLMPDDLVGTSGAAARGRRFFGSYDPEHVEVPPPASDGLVETESMSGTVAVPRRLHLGTVDGLFIWVTGYAGSDVTRVTVHPPVGPDVVASLVDGRFAAWWPAGAARVDNPGLSEAWTYTVTLDDGTTRQVQAR
ncbi:hypothetical protein [Microlunatus flavus]|uniref:Uncharacterized protein n=1 Tax=Microlunatus flavus TaxID=1036181 RepID=A0A1H9JEQ5_9ACTN|nr:hypothetical protein [Microlunatus flavus]SEQ85273.1 hypothetical protein SAMN05421756_106178 [Microlunatus flavus]